MKGGRLGPLDRWLSDGSLDALGLLIWWSLIVCPGHFTRLSFLNKFNSIVCPGRFGVLSWCNHILARLGLLKWCNEAFGLVQLDPLPRHPRQTRPAGVCQHYPCYPRSRQDPSNSAQAERRRIRSCNLRANALVCCSGTRGLCFNTVLGNVRCGRTSAVCMLSVTSCSRRP